MAITAIPHPRRAEAPAPAPRAYPREVLDAGWVPEVAELAALLARRGRPLPRVRRDDPLWQESASA